MFKTNKQTKKETKNPLESNFLQMILLIHLCQKTLTFFAEGMPTFFTI